MSSPLAEGDVDAFVRVSIDLARRLDPELAERRLHAAIRTLQLKGRITAERLAALLEEIKQVVARGKDPRRN